MPIIINKILSIRIIDSKLTQNSTDKVVGFVVFNTNKTWEIKIMKNK